MPIEQLKSIIEAALLASTQPLGVPQLRELFTVEDAVEPGQISAALEALAADCAGRGVELAEVASGYRYQVRQDIHPWLKRMWTERPSNYSRAMLETLALIAYRQPITRPEIEQIRGVMVSSSMIKTMEEREWVRVVGYRDMPGKPALYGTTRAFLDYFNLQSLDQLPPLSAIRDMEDPQLRLDHPDTALPATADVPDSEREPEREHAAVDTEADLADGAATADAAAASGAEPEPETGGTAAAPAGTATPSPHGGTDTAASPVAPSIPVEPSKTPEEYRA